MTRVATAATEELLLTMARGATGAQLEKVCRGFRQVRRAAAADDRARRQAAGTDRWVHRRAMGDGMVRIEMQLLADEAELVWQALEQVRSELVTNAAEDAAGPGAEEEGQEAQEPVAESATEDEATVVVVEAVDTVEAAALSAESRIDPSDPLAHLFAPEPEEPRGTWVRCEETGELVYYGSDPPDVWPEQYGLSAESEGSRAAGTRHAGVARRDGLPDRVDAMVALAERALAGGSLQEEASVRRAGDRQLLLIHLREDRVGRGETGANALDEEAAFVAELHDGTRIGGDTLMRLACDCSLAAVVTDGRGGVLDVGRRRRSVPPAIMRALLVRDRHCQFPGCCAQARIEAHHVEHWAHGGETRLDNLVLTCRFHHNALHEGGFTVSHDEGGALRFHDPQGRLIEATPAAAVDGRAAVCETADEELAAEQRARGLAIDRTTSLPRWDGSRPDIGAAVSALWWREERQGLG